ncbi:MAG TPA: peptidylprolyl isomerase [Polyangiaceae bacterium LLY-WYZ-15_(1-7)]|nr:peptidylprolyl isomerase [Polyangiaceae bacterium LLY-WYZ-15_(1-7)]HJK99943.1 peptidylprolyl isomerase [Polyangiaceae bacterium LLY-WYZ-15_(1-7)]HJL11469.1 peptidylprolyl isomerase [Polyangiaceae bacterium LLY-WYZ-15_(1-7)]HJL21508.1 peptidylprolyl isomerase [Polyangiaceae bacterium LLY-WYZ-15_(1-7)]
MTLRNDTPAPPVAEMVPGDGELRCKIVTNMGEMTARLFEKEVPRTVANFVALALGKVEWTDPKGQKTSAPLYKDLVVHRVIPDFMIQLGCPRGNGTGGPGWRFDDEIHPQLRHDAPGKLSMANAGPGTNGSQFFVTEVPTPHLDGRHAVFGELIDGLDVEKKIARVATDARDRPRQDVILQRIEVFRA